MYHSYALVLGRLLCEWADSNSSWLSVVGNYRVPTTQYLLLVRLLCQGILFPSYFSNSEVCHSWSPSLFYHCSSRMIASRLIMNALPSSNASVNISLSSGGTEVSSVFDSSLQTLSVVNLPQNLTTLLTVTYILSEQPTLFGLASFIITVPENA